MISHWPTHQEIDINVPISVEHGLQLRSQRGEIVKNWWGRGLLAAMDSTAVKEELDAGKRYARKGQIEWMECSESTVKASVQGRDDKPYTVTIAFKALPGAAWTAVLTELSQRLDLCGAILGGSMPEDVQALFERHDAAVLPADPPHSTCDCERTERPCRHMLAVACLVADRVDTRPLLLFELRGLPQEQFMTRLRELWNLPLPDVDDADVPQPSERSVTGYYRRPDVEPATQPTAPPKVDVLAKLGIPQFFNQDDQTSLQTLRKLYHDHIRR